MPPMEMAAGFRSRNSFLDTYVWEPLLQQTSCTSTTFLSFNVLWFHPPLTLHIPMYTFSAILVQIRIASHEFFYAPELNMGVLQEGLGL